MKKLLNLRFPLIIAIALVVGVASAYFCVYFNLNLAWAFCITTVLLIVFAIVFWSENKIKLIIALICTLAFNTVGVLLSHAKLEKYKGDGLANAEQYQFSAVVEEVSFLDDNCLVIMNSVEADGNKLDCKINAYLDFDVARGLNGGDKVSFIATVEKYDLFNYGRLNSRAIDNIKYTISVNSTIDVVDGYDFFGSINVLLKDSVYTGDEQTATIVYAMLTGNTTGIEDGTIESFRYGGIAHVFAVSGLHIGLLYTALEFAFKKLRANRLLSSVIICLVLLLYCGVCGFTPSSVRATVMCIISCIARLIYGKYDSLNALSLAVIILLLINPLYLFGVGFQLSVVAVLSIITLSPNVKRLLVFLPDKFSGAIAVCLSAQVGTLPLLITSFGYVSVASLIINLVVLPLLSALYVIIFACVVLGVILPFMASVLTYVSFLPLQAIISFFVGLGLENTLIGGAGGLLFIPLYFIPLVLFTDKVNLGIISRATCIALSFAIFCGYTLAQIFVLDGDAILTVCATYGGGTIVIKDSNYTTVVLTEDVYVENLNLTLSKHGANRPDNIVVLGGETCIEKCFAFGITAPNLYLPYSNVPLQPFNNSVVHYEKEFKLGDIKFEYVDGYNLNVDIYSSIVRISDGGAGQGNADLLVTGSIVGDFVAENIVYYQLKTQNLSVYNCGDLRFLANGGKLKLITATPDTFSGKK